MLGLLGSTVAAMLMLTPMLGQSAKLMLAGVIVVEVTHLELVSFLLPAAITKKWTTQWTKASPAGKVHRGQQDKERTRGAISPISAGSERTPNLQERKFIK